MGNNEGKSGFWGTTMNRLKSVLAKTKDQVDVAGAFDESAQATGQTAADPAAAPQAVHAGAMAPAENATQKSQENSSAGPPQSTVRAAAKPAETPPRARPVRVVDEDFIDSLQDRLIRADLGLGNVETIINDLKRESKSKNWNSLDVETFLKREFGQ
jgi:signal recognition particle GTPase